MRTPLSPKKSPLQGTPVRISTDRQIDRLINTDRDINKDIKRDIKNDNKENVQIINNNITEIKSNSTMNKKSIICNTNNPDKAADKAAKTNITNTKSSNNSNNNKIKKSISPLKKSYEDSLFSLFF